MKLNCSHQPHTRPAAAVTLRQSTQIGHNMSGIVLIVRHVQVDRIKQVVVDAYSVNGPEISTFTWVERLPPSEPAGRTSRLVRQHYDVWSWKRISIIKFEKKKNYFCGLYIKISLKLLEQKKKTPMCHWVFRLAKMI